LGGVTTIKKCHNHHKLTKQTISDEMAAARREVSAHAGCSVDDTDEVRKRRDVGGRGSDGVHAHKHARTRWGGGTDGVVVVLGVHRARSCA